MAGHRANARPVPRAVTASDRPGCCAASKNRDIRLGTTGGAASPGERGGVSPMVEARPMKPLVGVTGGWRTGVGWSWWLAADGQRVEQRGLRRMGSTSVLRGTLPPASSRWAVRLTLRWAVCPANWRRSLSRRTWRRQPHGGSAIDESPRWFDRRVANGSWLVVLVDSRRAKSRAAWIADGGNPRRSCVARFHQPADAGPFA
jgi:hypothetical protein